MLRTIALSLIICLIAFSTDAQRKKRKKKDNRQQSEKVVQTNRAELTVNYEDPTYKVVAGDEDGVFLFRDTDSFRKGSFEYEVIRYDSTLLQSWITKFRLNQQFRLKGYEYHDGSFYMMFNNRNVANHSILLVELNPSTGDTTMYSVDNIIPIQYTEFVMVGRTAVFGGYTDQLPTVYTYDLDSKKFRVIPGFYNRKSQLLEIKPNHDQLSFNVLTSERNYRRKNMIVMKTIRKDGELLKTVEIQPEGNKNLVFARSAMRGRGEDFFVAGTYSENRSEYSRGIFVARLSQKSDDLDVKYYNYADFENFFGYMRDRRENRVKNKIEKRKSVGKKLRFNYRLLVHDVVPSGDNYVIIGEAFYPRYSNSPPASRNPYYSGLGGAFTSGQNYFVGFRFTHAVAFEFDPGGNLVWDNSFELEDLTSFDLEQKVHVKLKDDLAVMTYSYENELRTKILKQGEILEGESYTSVALKYESDDATGRNIDKSALEPWYDDWFLAYGIQKIKNTSSSNPDDNRRVFYINKFRVN